MFKIVIKFFNIIFLVLLFSITVLILIPFLSRKNIQIFKVVSGSMVPKIKTGSIIIVKKINPNLIKTNDIISFSLANNPKTIVTHRVVGIEKKENNLKFKTKGDANNTQDLGNIEANQIKGIVVLSVPILGYLSDWTKNPLGFITLIILPGLFIIVSELFNLYKNIEKSIKKKYGLKIILIPLFFSNCFINIKTTNAYFSNSYSLTNNNLSTGYWLSPNTDITNDDFVLNRNNIQINYNIEYQNNLDYVQLCYSFNLGEMFCPENPSYRNKSGSFDFIAQLNGIYKFYTISHTTNGSTEDINRIDKINYSVQVDTVPPTSNISYSISPVKIWTGQNLINNSNWISIGNGEHHFVNDPDLSKDVYLLGYKNILPSSTNESGIYQNIFLPQNIVSNLSFKYKFSSNDIADNSNFSVQVRGLNDQVLENVILVGNTDIGASVDSEWNSVIRSISSFNNQSIKLWFGVNNNNSNNTRNTWVYLDDIKLMTVDPRIGDTFPIGIESNDISSGIYFQSTLPQIIVGENNLNFNAIDSALNEESNKKIDFIVLPEIVLNKIYFSQNQASIEIYNNNQNQINLSGMYFENSIGSTYPISNIDINSTESSIIDIPFDSEFNLNLPQNTLIIKNADNQIFDKISYNLFNNQILKRTPDGIGSWGFVNQNSEETIDLNLIYRPTSNKILLSIFNIPKDQDNLNYEIIYTSNSIEKSIYGNIDLKDIVDQKIDREFYLGTCSTGGLCLSDTNLSGDMKVNLFQFTKTINIFQ